MLIESVSSSINRIDYSRKLIGKVKVNQPRLAMVKFMEMHLILISIGKYFLSIYLDKKYRKNIGLLYTPPRSLLVFGDTQVEDVISGTTRKVSCFVRNLYLYWTVADTRAMFLAFESSRWRMLEELFDLYKLNLMDEPSKDEIFLAFGGRGS